VTASAPSFAAGSTPLTSPVTLSRAAASAALVAATTMAVAMAYLAIAHVAGGMRFGDGQHSAIVDGLHVVTALALLPIPFALHRLLGSAGLRASAAGVALAVDAIAFGAILHALFALGIVSFEAAGPLVLIAYLAFAGWLWIVGSLGSASGLLPNGRRMALLAATIVGLPVWLAWIARRLEAA
jgi:hypothetical protein